MNVCYVQLMCRMHLTIGKVLVSVKVHIIHRTSTETRIHVVMAVGEKSFR